MVLDPLNVRFQAMWWEAIRCFDSRPGVSAKLRVQKIHEDGVPALHLSGDLDLEATIWVGGGGEGLGGGGWGVVGGGMAGLSQTKFPDAAVRRRGKTYHNFDVGRSALNYHRKIEGDCAGLFS